MIFDFQTAKKLEVLVHPDVEKAILLLLNIVLEQEEEVYSNPEATDAQLRIFQGKKMLIRELKEYRTRLGDAIKRDKDAGSESSGQY